MSPSSSSSVYEAWKISVLSILLSRFGVVAGLLSLVVSLLLLLPEISFGEDSTAVAAAAAATSKVDRAECQMWAKLENKTLPLQNQGHANCSTNKKCTGFHCEGMYQVRPCGRWEQVLRILMAFAISFLRIPHHFPRRTNSKTGKKLFPYYHSYYRSFDGLAKKKMLSFFFSNLLLFLRFLTRTTIKYLLLPETQEVTQPAFFSFFFLQRVCDGGGEGSKDIFPPLCAVEAAFLFLCFPPFSSPSKPSSYPPRRICCVLLAPCSVRAPIQPEPPHHLFWSCCLVLCASQSRPSFLPSFLPQEFLPLLLVLHREGHSLALPRISTGVDIYEGTKSLWFPRVNDPLEGGGRKRKL